MLAATLGVNTTAPRRAALEGAPSSGDAARLFGPWPSRRPRCATAWGAPRRPGVGWSNWSMAAPWKP